MWGGLFLKSMQAQIPRTWRMINLSFLEVFARFLTWKHNVSSQFLRALRTSSKASSAYEELPEHETSGVEDVEALFKEQVRAKRF